MSTLATRFATREREPLSFGKAHAQAAGHEAASVQDRHLSSWTLLFGSLCLSAGHGFILVVALGKLYGLPNLNELGGPRTSLVVAWFLASIALAPLALLQRPRLSRSRLIGPLSILVALITALAFAAYAYKIARG